MQKNKILKLGIGLLIIALFYAVFIIPMTQPIMKSPTYEFKYKAEVVAKRHMGICGVILGLSIAFIISGLVAKENKKTDTKA